MTGTTDRIASASNTQPANGSRNQPTSVHPCDAADQLRRLAALVELR